MENANKLQKQQEPTASSYDPLADVRDGLLAFQLRSFVHVGCPMGQQARRHQFGTDSLAVRSVPLACPIISGVIS